MAPEREQASVRRTARDLRRAQSRRESGAELARLRRVCGSMGKAKSFQDRSDVAFSEAGKHEWPPLHRCTMPCSRMANQVGMRDLVPVMFQSPNDFCHAGEQVLASARAPR